MPRHDEKIRTIREVLGPARMTRQGFLRLSATSLVGASLGALAFGEGCTIPPGSGDDDGTGSLERDLRFVSLDDALEELALIEAHPPVEMLQEWSLFKVLHHLAQSAEYSMTGFPEEQPALVQAIGKAVFNGFVDRGYMSHDLAAVVPSAPEIPDDGPLPEAFARLRAAIAVFKSHTGALYPHFAYGELTREEWELAHAFHCADHFSSLTYEIA